MAKIADLENVRANCEGFVELHNDEATGRFVIRAYNQCGHDFIEIDLCDLLEWMRSKANLTRVAIDALARA